MALKKEAPEFDVDDEVLLLEPALVLDEVEENEKSFVSARIKPATSSARQHKHIDYSRALDATQLSQ